MSHCINIEEEIYKKFQAALLLTGEEENTVLCRLISQYAHQAFEHVMKKTEKEELTIKNQSNIMNTIDTDNQKHRETRQARSGYHTDLAVSFGRTECVKPALSQKSSVK